ncbi:MAG: hypothetical protein U0992_23650 [Planctomycetaceae bacterium]
MPRFSRYAILASFAGIFSGCSLLPYELQPGQLWKMNRQSPWDEGTMSVPDPVDPRLADHPTHADAEWLHNSADVR